MSELTFTPVIGIEIHIRLKSDSKLFCSCSTNTDAPANTNICPVCMGLPGTLPRLNHRVVEQGMLAGFALNCGIRPKSLFFRKSYFYPDLPKGHQVSQCDLPITTSGYIEVHDDNGNLKKIRVHHLHLEEDVGSLHHSASDGRLEGADTSYVDYNRSGTPLAEIVSEPDVASAREAVEYVTTLRRRVIYSGASDVELEKGMMRFDANVSMKCSDGRWGKKVEVKNMNSFKALERAIEFEIKRQKKLMLAGEDVMQETRHWNDAKGITSPSRVKESYRKFIVEPDLPPLYISQEWIDRMKAKMPEMPDVRADRYVNEMGVPREVADFLTDDKNLADYFEACVKAGAKPVRAAHWIRTEVLRVLNEKQLKISDFHFKPEVLTDLVTRVDDGKLSTTQGKEVFDYMIANSVSIDDAVKSLNITEGGVAGNALSEIIEAVLKANPDVLEEIKSGKDKKGKKLKFLQGLVMKESKGQAKPQEVAEAIAEAVK